MKLFYLQVILVDGNGMLHPRGNMFIIIIIIIIIVIIVIIYY